MAHLTESEQGRLARLEQKATEIRKMLFGALLPAKDLWKNELIRTDEGRALIEELEKAEDSFVDSFESDTLKRLEETIEVAGNRTRGIFDLMSSVSKHS